ITHKEILSETRFLTDQGAGVCVGKPVVGMDVKIIRISDDPIPTWDDNLVLGVGEIGEIAVRGASASHTYYKREAATAVSKIYCEDVSFYHRMGDVGYLDAQGRLWFCGRKVHRVITASETLFSVPCEGIFNTHPHVFRTALVGAQGEPVLCVELEKG